MAEEILGKNFYFTDITMRIVPKTKNILETHRDFCGGLSFSLLRSKNKSIPRKKLWVRSQIQQV